MRYGISCRVLPLCVAVFTIAAAGQAAGLAAIDIPYTRYVLSNGLTLLVHEDPKAAQISVDINYRVGSGDEPAGRSGLSHLFEHLMFNGSEHYDHDWFEALQPLGANAATANGTAYQDRTHYSETVPSGALDAILWLESDRMGHLAGAIDQAKLDEQRGVVHNERRSIENTPWQDIGNNPYGPSAARIAAAIWPEGHPYSHLYIGSAHDLDAITLEDVRDWCKTWYAPSNAVLVLAGNITPSEAKDKVERYFGALPPGPPITRTRNWTEPRRGTRRDVMYDSQSGTAAFARIWSIPGAGEGTADADYLDLLGSVLGHKASRLKARLMSDAPLSSDVFVGIRKNEIGSQFSIRVTAMPGVELARIEHIVDEELDRAMREGPSADELNVARMSRVAEMVASIQSTSFKASILGKSELFLGSADGWKGSFERLQAAQPADLAAASRRWLGGGDYILAVVPQGKLRAASTDVSRASGVPAVQVTPVTPPKFVRTVLSNGLQLLFVERHDAPQVTLNLMIPTGIPARGTKLPAGVAELAMSLSNEATTQRSSAERSAALARLGASLETKGDDDFAQLSLTTLAPALSQALELFADTVLNPAFSDAELERLKARNLGKLANSRSNPISAADRIGPKLLFGPDHPYGRQQYPQLSEISRADVIGFHRGWIRPNRATLVAVGDITLPKLRAELEAALSSWKAAPIPDIVKPQMPPPRQPMIWLLDAPGISQSSIQVLLPVEPHAHEREVILTLLNKVISGRLISNLREDKHWTYGVLGEVTRQSGPRLFRLHSLVQTDRTAAALAEIRRELTQLSERGVTQGELERVQQETVRGLADSWETHKEVAAAVSDIVFYGLQDDYLQSYARRVEQVRPADLSKAAAELLSRRSLTWVVVGDLARIESDVRALGLGEVRIIDADEATENGRSIR